MSEELATDTAATHAERGWMLRARRAARDGSVAGWLQVVETSAVRVFLVVVSLMGTALTARHLGPVDRGIMVAAQGWLATFTALGYLSMAQPLFRRVSGKPANEWLPEAMGTLLSIVAVVSLLGWAVLAGTYWFSGGEIFKRLSPAVLAAAFIGLPFTLWGENGNSLMLAIGRLRALNLIQLGAGIASLATLFVALQLFGANVEGALLATAVSPVLAATIGIALMLRLSPGLRASWTTARQLLSEGSRLHLNAVGSVLSGHATILILNYYRTPAETAYLHLAGQMLIGLSIIPASVSNVSYTLIARDGADGAWPAQKRLLGQSLVVMSLLCGVAYVLAPYGVRIIAGDKFADTVPLFRLLLPTVLLTTVTVGTVSQWIARGLFWWLAIYGMILGVITVVSMFILVPRYGMFGAVYVSLLTSSIALAMNVAVIVWIERRWRESLLPRPESAAGA